MGGETLMSGRSPTKVVLWHILGFCLTFLVAFWLRPVSLQPDPASSRLPSSHQRLAGFRFCRTHSRPFPGHPGPYLPDSRWRFSSFWGCAVGLQRSLLSVPARSSHALHAGSHRLVAQPDGLGALASGCSARGPFYSSFATHERRNRRRPLDRRRPHVPHRRHPSPPSPGSLPSSGRFDPQS